MTANYAHISDYAGLKRLTEKRLKVMKNEKTALNLFLRKKECWKTTILCKFLCLLTFTLVVFVPYKFWLGIVYEIVVIDSQIGKVDAIILENRGEEDKNVELTAELFKNGYAKLIFTTGPKSEEGKVNSSINKARALRFKEELIELGIDENSIIPIEQEERGTYVEANASVEYFAKHGIKSVIIVTNPHHQLRTLLTYKKVYKGKGKKFLVTSAELSWFRADNWWKNHNAIQSVHGEYMSLIYYFINCYI